MKITVKHLNTEVIIDESDNKTIRDGDNKASIRYSDQAEQVQKTITVIVSEIIRLNNSIQPER